MNTFGQVVPVLGPLEGYPGQPSRTADAIIESRTVLPTTATNLPFGAGAVLLASGQESYVQSLADYLATATNAQYVQQKFAGVAVREVRTMQPFSALSQAPASTVATTATQATVGSSTIVVASASGIALGQSVEGFGIQPGTLVTGISTTTITISLPTTGVLSATAVVFTNASTLSVGNYGPGVKANVLVRSSVTVLITAGTPAAGAPVYVRTVANTAIPGTSVGDFEAAADLATSALTYGCTIDSATFTTSGATGLAPGQMVTGPGIPANTYIVSGATTSWVFSQKALATIASGAALSAYNTGLLGSVVDPWIKFREGTLDSNNIAEILIPQRRN